jgi:hypothetical protein
MKTYKVKRQHSSWRESIEKKASDEWGSLHMILFTMKHTRVSCKILLKDTGYPASL